MSTSPYQALYGKRETGSNRGEQTRKQLFNPTHRLGPQHRFQPILPPLREMSTPSIPVVTESATLLTTTAKTTTTTTTEGTTRRPTPGNPSSPGFRRPDLCDDSKIDAITTLNDGNIYVFKGKPWVEQSVFGSSIQSSGKIFPTFRILRLPDRCNRKGSLARLASET